MELPRQAGSGDGDDGELATAANARARLQHRGAGKALTWDQFSFDKILPVIQAGGYGEQEGGDASAETGLGGLGGPAGRLSWFNESPKEDHWDDEHSSHAHLGGGSSPSMHKRAATIATTGLSDGFDLSSLTASLSQSFLDSNDDDGVSGEGQDGSENEEKHPREASSRVGRKQDLETIAEQDYRSATPKHRRSHTHAAATSYTPFNIEDAGPMDGGSSYNAWGSSALPTAVSGSPVLSRTKSDISALDISTLAGESWQFKAGYDGDKSTQSPPSASSKSSASLPMNSELDSPSASSAGLSTSSPRDLYQAQGQGQPPPAPQPNQQQQQAAAAAAAMAQYGYHQHMQYPQQQQPVHHHSPNLQASRWSGAAGPQAGMGYGYGEGASPSQYMDMSQQQPDPIMMQQWMQHQYYYQSQGHFPPAPTGYPSQMQAAPQQVSQWQQQQQQQQQAHSMYGMHGHANPNAGNMGMQNMHIPRNGPPKGNQGASLKMGGNMQMLQQQQMPGGSANPISSMGTIQPAQAKPMCPALVEYRASGRRPTMEELTGHVVEFSRDAHGSRFIQFKMETASVEEKQVLVDEVAMDAIGLMQDTFGNYVLQNFLEHATTEQRYILGRTMKGHMIRLSSQAHGCRVVQRAILLLPTSLRNELLAELLMNPEDTCKCARNSHATHVMQKVVSLIVSEEVQRLQSGAPEETYPDSPSTCDLLRSTERSVEIDFVALSVHPHAYRLVLTVMDDCNPERSTSMTNILENILKANMDRLAKDQHGNFILQHILNRGNEAQKSMVQQFVSDHVVELAQHKFGSHLVEKCLSCASPAQVESFVQQIIRPTKLNSEQSKILAMNAQGAAAAAAGGQNKTGPSPSSVVKGRKAADGAEDTLLLLMSDPYANFVVQRAFDASQGALRQTLVEEIKSRSDVLSKFTYGRHALSHLSKSLGERTERGQGAQDHRKGQSGGGQGGGAAGGGGQQKGNNNNNNNSRYKKK